VVIKKILIANRGEIAIRVINTCRLMGIKTVTLFTEGEEDLPHAKLSDFAISLGSGALRETYLNIEKIVKICIEHKVDAVHPGYGFLSENADFSRALDQAKILFIGPTPENIKLMGDKIGSKKFATSVGVPCIPGYHGEDQSLETLKGEAKKIGYPVLIKASSGGGGKGMKVALNDAEFAGQLESAKREAKNSFGDDAVLLEKYLTGPRHIEIQMMSDSHGNHLHFFERECSIQRRHQKIIEESPSPILTSSIREKIAACAVKITSQMNYLGAGTMEFIFQDNEFYFLEMNTRLQVEHPVTEMVTGVDLVRLQILVAQKEKLPLMQKDIKQIGHAIEVRIYAENPDADFLPTTGTIKYLGETKLSNVRLDTGYMEGNDVSIQFDPMIAKLIVWDEDRSRAIAKMQEALNDYPFLGMINNVDYLKRVLGHKKFISGDTLTSFVQTYEKDLAPKDVPDEIKKVAEFAAKFIQQNGPAVSSSLWQELGSGKL